MAVSDMVNGIPELVLIRHAPVLRPGILCGRTDQPARIDELSIAGVARHVGAVDRVISSPALRCRQTAAALWSTCEAETDPRLWEQDFGAHDGLPYTDLPDLGPMSNAALAAYAAPGGESFEALCARARPAIVEASERAAARSAPVALVVHAGVIRAALACTTGDLPGALSFEIAPLSVTRLRVAADGPFAVRSVNWTAAA
ncbi:MAG: histidine phosphatase family protein [Paracoccaceae bacterium]